METTSQAAAPVTGEGALTSFRFSASDADNPSEAWRAFLAILFDYTLPRRSAAGTFDARIVVHHFGGFLLCASFVSSGRCRRSETRLLWDDLDHIVISCLLHGRIGLGGPIRRLLPGDVVVSDLSAPANFSLADAEMLHLIVPRTALPLAVSPTMPVSQRIFVRQTAMAILLRGIIESLSQASAYLRVAEVMALSAAVPDLLGWYLATAPFVSPTAAKVDLGRRVRRYVEDNLMRHDLTSTLLAREMGVSRSQLYRQFEASGGVESYIRHRRLRRCLQALADPRRANLRIGEIAYAMGFADEAYFSRLFRQTFGRSPREMRVAARQSGQGPASAVSAPVAGPSFAEWLTALGIG